MAKGLTPTQRSMAHFRARGMNCGVVERWIPNPKHPGGGFRSDFLGCIDMIYFSAADGIVGVQSCGQDFSAHRKKITEDKKDEVTSWLEAGAKFVLIGWRKKKQRKADGSWGKAMRWEPRVEEITMEDLQ